MLLRKRPWTWFLAVLLVCSVFIGTANAASDRDSLFANLRTVFQTVEQYHKNGADLDKFIQGAIRGGIEALGDPYTNYFSPTEFASFLDSLNGNVTGIGIYLDLEDNYVIVSAPIKGSPAFRAGLRTGDRILAADGVSLVGATIEKAQQLIRGDEGTSVILKVERPAEQRVFEVTITRELIQIPQVDYELRDGGVGYLALTSFGATAAQEFFSAVDTLKKDGATSLILDLRQNPGGYVAAAVTIASAWVPKGEPIMYEIGRDGEQVHRSTGRLINMPTVVMIDGGSASASEILAGAIRDYRAGTLVGTKSFGKGTVQQLLFMQDGAGMKVTIAEYLTGKRTKVDGRGVSPDIVVTPPQVDPLLSKPMSTTRLLYQGVVGLDVLDLQNRLEYLGYSTDSDGVLGTRTVRAIQGFRMDYGLSTLAVADKEFINALNKYVTERRAELLSEDLALTKAMELLNRR